MKVNKLQLWRVAREDRGDPDVVEWDLDIEGDDEAKDVSELNLDDYGLWVALHKALGWASGSRRVAYAEEVKE